MSEKPYAHATPAAVPLESAPQITIIIPTRNESDNIQPLLQKLAQALAELQFEALFVDDSTDDTADIIAALAGDYPFPIRVNKRPVERRNGLSGAVVEGLSEARGAWVCVMDADLQHPPETITRMWEQAAKTNADIVVGSRRGDMFGPYGLSRLRSLNSKLLTILARTLFPRRLKNVSDPLTGLFLVRREAVNAGELRPDGFKILLEILVRCPALHVAEIHFDFAPRLSGESKADVREGARFLRHLLVLRSTANPHLGRFVIVVMAGLLLNTALLGALLRWVEVSALPAALAAAELTWVGIFLALELWVFSEREEAGRGRRFWGYFLLTQLTLLVVFLPVMYVLTDVFNVNVLLSNLFAFFAVGLVRYLLSEQSVWTRSAMAWQPQSHYYDLHSLLRVESQIPLRELEQFLIVDPLDAVDLQIRVDRQGTPSDLPGGIRYDEHLGRFGFGLSVLPGEYTQIVVSPLLEHSSEFLFTNIIEPVIRWQLVTRGYALAKAACVAKDADAVLISSEQDLGTAVAELCRNSGYAFLADDRTILSSSGEVFSYPKPLTIDNTMLEASGLSPTLKNRLALWSQRLLYTRAARRLGLWLSGLQLPAATVNTYLQRFVPQPKQHLEFIFPDVALRPRALLREIVRVEPSSLADSPGRDIVMHLRPDDLAVGFQPLPLLAEKLRVWGGEDLVVKEQQIIEQAIRGLPVQRIDSAQHPWWYEVADSESDVQSSAAGSQPRMRGPMKEPASGPQGELGATG